MTTQENFLPNKEEKQAGIVKRAKKYNDSDILNPPSGTSKKWLSWSYFQGNKICIPAISNKNVPQAFWADGGRLQLSPDGML